MSDIFNINFSVERKNYTEIITPLMSTENKAFAYDWQCFSWAAVLGFINSRRILLDEKSIVRENTFSLDTMRTNGGESIAYTLLCLCIAKENTLDILKDTALIIRLINEYANGGFRLIREQMNRESRITNYRSWVTKQIFPEVEESSD